MLFPLRRVLAIVVSTLIFSTKEVNGRNNNRGSSSSDCDNNLEESECDDQWACEWQYDEDGYGYCASALPTWVYALIAIGAIGGCIFCCWYTRYQRRRRLQRAQNGPTHQPAVALQPARNPVPPSISRNPVPPTASYAQQPYAQQPYTQPYNQAYNNPQVGYNPQVAYKPQVAYNPQEAYNPPPSYQYGGAPTAPPPPAYEADGQKGAA